MRTVRTDLAVAAALGAAVSFYLLRRWRAPPCASSAGEVCALFIHPVKSCAPVQVDAATLDRLGFVDDRRLMVVAGEACNGSHAFLTQRQVPEMCLVGCELRGDKLTLRAPGRAPLALGLKPPAGGMMLITRVWSDAGLVAADYGEAAAGWLSEYLGTPARLVGAAHGAWRRPLDAKYTPRWLRWAWGGPQVGVGRVPRGPSLVVQCTSNRTAGSLSASSRHTTLRVVHPASRQVDFAGGGGVGRVRVVV